jgi:hypothetical protein
MLPGKISLAICIVFIGDQTLAEMSGFFIFVMKMKYFFCDRNNYAPFCLFLQITGKIIPHIIE